MKCTCKLWHTLEPDYDPGCEYEKHAEMGFEQRGWSYASVTGF